MCASVLVLVLSDVVGSFRLVLMAVVQLRCPGYQCCIWQSVGLCLVGSHHWGLIPAYERVEFTGKL